MNKQKIRYNLTRLRRVLNLLAVLCVVMAFGLVKYANVDAIKVISKPKMEAIIDGMLDKFKTVGNDFTHNIEE